MLGRDGSGAVEAVPAQGVRPIEPRSRPKVTGIGSGTRECRRPGSSMRGFRVGLDIGGTFTDFVLLNDTIGEIRLHKVLTTTPDPAEGALRGLVELCRLA